MDAKLTQTKPTRSELNKMLLTARKAAKMTQDDLEQLAADNFDVPISELDDVGIINLIDLCNAKQ